MTIITSPVSVTKVRQVLSETSNDVGTLCSSNRINMWAKYKPIRYPSVKRLTDIQRKGTDGNRGFSIPTKQTILAVMDCYDGDMNGWEYLKPTGGSTAPYRLGDFENYNSDALEPIGGLAVAAQISAGSGISVSADIIISNEQDETQLQLKDFDAVRNCYFGVALIKDGAVKYRLTSDKTIAAGGGLDVVFNNNGGKWPVGNYSVVPFLSTAQYATTDTPDTSAVYRPLPVMQPAVCRVVSDAELVNVGIYAEYMSSTRRNIKVTLVNNDTSAYARVYVYCLLSSRKETTDLVSSIQAGEKQRMITALRAGGTSELIFTSTGTQDNSTGSFTYCTWGQVSFNDGKVVKVFQIADFVDE